MCSLSNIFCSILFSTISILEKTKSSKMNNIIQDLTCPLTLELFVDPVTVPCCGKSFSRQPLITHINHKPTCPLCNADLEQFDVVRAAKNVLLSGMVDTIQNKPPEAKLKPHTWNCTLTPVADHSPWSELKLTIDHATFSVRPSLFIAVLDRSGSMAGKSATQVSTALKHIVSLSKINTSVKLIILSYGSDCQEIFNAEDYKIDGGTNFRAAFAMVDNVLARYICSNEEKDLHKMNNVSSVTVAFLTDGEDTSGSRDRLVPEFKEMLHNRWKNNPLYVHTIGFGTSCDKNLLEGMRMSGTLEGMFRYAEPTDNDDELCQKLTGIFEVSTKSSTVPIQFTYGNQTQTVQFPINSNKYGEYKEWVQISDLKTVTIHSSVDHDVTIVVQHNSCNEFTWQHWINYQVDQLAVKVLALNAQHPAPSDKMKTLQCALLLKTIEDLETANNSKEVALRLQYIHTQVQELKIGKAINVGKLSDLRFGSRFEQKNISLLTDDTKLRSIPLPPSSDLKSPLYLDNEPYNEQPLKHYSRNNKDKNRNPLQELIMDHFCDVLPEKISNVLSVSTLEDIIFRDIHGNNTLMLAAYCGHSKIVKAILDQFPQVNIEEKNNDGETAVTLAIKKRGFHHTLGVLVDKGARIPRVKQLARYAIENGFVLTGQFISQFGDGSTTIDTSMTVEYIQFIYNRLKNAGTPFDKQVFLGVALEKNMLSMVSELLEVFQAQPTLDMLINYCIPKKPDDPETERYLKLAQMLVQKDPSLVKQLTHPEQESALFAAARKGSLPHVKYFISEGSVIDQPNEKGNTPFWVSCYQRYPCIMDELLKFGANINHVNIKGNIPLYGCCERGNPKVAESLIEKGAKIDHVNSNGDTLVLLCCRNGQSEVLQVLLRYVDDEFVNQKAHIDGFNAIMACAEQNRAECIRILADYKIDLNQKTDPDNAILKSATPLHIAVYYDRLEAATMLLHCNANVNEPDYFGQTPLHLAVIQGNIKMIHLLKKNGANITQRDQSGNIPIAYCRNKKEIQEALVDPLLDILIELAKGGWLEEENKACEVLSSYRTILGHPLDVDVMDMEGSTPLIYAVIYGKYHIVSALLDLGANPLRPNVYTMNALLWSKFTRNQRIVKLLLNYCQLLEPIEDTVQWKRLVVKGNGLFLGSPPQFVNLTSTITQRMGQFINTPVTQQTLSKISKTINLPTLCDTKEAIISQVAETFSDPQMGIFLWEAKIFTVHKIAAAANDEPSCLNMLEILSLAGWTNNNIVHSLINTAILTSNFTQHAKLYADILYTGLSKLPVFQGECFIGTADADRKLFMIGQEFMFQHFVSGSTNWKIALENTPNFTSKNRKGIIFIVKSQTGRHVSLYSQFSYDSEIIFLPHTRFRVKSWYHGGDVICLGQENIREHTFKIKERDDERMNLEQVIQSDKSIVIELIEI